MLVLLEPYKYQSMLLVLNTKTPKLKQKQIEHITTQYWNGTNANQ